MSEIWKPVVGYEGSYEVSDLGRVRSLDRVVERLGFEMKLRGKVLRPGLAGKGYPFLLLYRDGRGEPKYVHALVAEAFVGKRREGQEVRHIDGLKLNVRASNLEYGTAQQNTADKARHGTVLSGERIPTAKLTSAKVLRIRKTPNVTQRQWADRFGVSQAAISMAATGRTWRHV